MIAIIDCDTVIYEIAYLDIDDWINVLVSKLRNILEATQTNKYILIIQGNRNFRNKFDKNYKKHRVTEKPKHFKDIKKYIINNYNHFIAHNIETDDVCCIMANYCKSINCEFTLVHLDKDLNQIPGLHYNYRKKEFYNITEEEALYNLSYQIIKGDSTDSKITGIKGLGNIKTNKILKDKKDPLITAFDIYIKHFGLNGVDLFYITYSIVKLLTSYPKLDNKIQKIINDLCNI